MSVGLETTGTRKRPRNASGGKPCPNAAKSAFAGSTSISNRQRKRRAAIYKGALRKLIAMSAGARMSAPTKDRLPCGQASGCRSRLGSTVVNTLTRFFGGPVSISCLPSFRDLFQRSLARQEKCYVVRLLWTATRNAEECAIHQRACIHSPSAGRRDAGESALLVPRRA